MFEQSLLMDGARRSSPWSFAASVTVQSALVAAALVMPLMHVAKMETRLPDILFLPRSIGERVHVQQAPAQGVASSGHVGRTYRAFTAPTRIPNHVATGPDLPGTPEYSFAGSTGSGDPRGVDIGLLPGLEQRTMVVPPPVESPRHTPQPAATQPPLRVGLGVQAAKLVFGPAPVYPPLARQARISGAVLLAAQISADGHIQNLRVVSGHPMLVQAAMGAVSKWVYKPTLLNGQPVEVLTEILVNFVLN
jgi:protein TonB